MGETLFSVGIDLGTTTTQLVFSRLELENTASPMSIPRISITDKEIIYRSPIHFTPLIDKSVIDAVKVRQLVEEEYRRANLLPKDISAGAVIITGETARKENSEAVLSTLSGLAGDFVVATAGGDLEAIIAGRGAGTAALSRQRPGRLLVNLDIGGGTTNTAVFQDGDPVDSTCLDIGGRQIKIDPQSLNIVYVAPKMAVLADKLGLKLKEGSRAIIEDLMELCRHLASLLACSLGLGPGDPAELDLLQTTSPIGKWDLSALTFSGGVADFIYGDYDPKNPFPYGDIGPILGFQIKNCPQFKTLELLRPKETIRATVIGAGANTMEISGSTITISEPSILPLKNIPILKLTARDESLDYKYFASKLSEKMAWFKDEKSDRYQTVAVAFRGITNPTFESIGHLRDLLVEALSDYLRFSEILVVVLECDMAKSLGQALVRVLPGKKIISLDTVKVENGDYIDIGSPLAGGRVVPVVVKTLVFDK